MMPNLWPFTDVRCRSAWRAAGALVFLTVLFGFASAGYAGGIGHWEPQPVIEAYYSQSANYVGVGKEVIFKVSGKADGTGAPLDEDTWVINGQKDHDAPDTPLTTHWTITYPAGGWTPETSPLETFKWTAPTGFVGTFNVSVTIDDPVGDREGRGDDQWTASGSVTVCRISGLTADGTQESGKSTHYINRLAATGNCVVTASISPSYVLESVLPAGFVTWAGGTAPTPANQLTRLVPLSAVADTTVKAKVGTVDEKAVLIHVVDGGAAFVGQPSLTNTRAGDMACEVPFGVGNASTVSGNPIASYQVYLPEYSNGWHFPTTGVVHYYRTGINGGANHDLVFPAYDWWLESHWQTAVTDLTPVEYDDPVNAVILMKPPRTITWCSDITSEHEEFHMEEFHTLHWEGWITNGFIPWVDQQVAYFNCDTGVTTQAAARALKDATIQEKAALATNLAWADMIADTFREQRAYDNDLYKYLDRCFWITFYWP